MKVLFLTKYPPAGASSRYRVFQYLPYLDAAGVDYRVQSFMNPAMYALAQRPGHALRKSLHAAAALTRRLAALWRCGRYDLIFLQRECLPLGPPLMERLFRRWQIPTIFDYDDALFIVKPSTHNGFADGLRSGARTREILRLVDCVLAGNDWLRARAVDAGAAAARTLHVAEDLARCVRRAPRNTWSCCARRCARCAGVIRSCACSSSAAARSPIRRFLSSTAAGTTRAKWTTCMRSTSA